jgi:hypothetical protein
MAVAMGTATAAQWLLNAAMNANPIGIVIMAIAALVGAIVALVKWGHKVSWIFITIAGIVFGPLGAAIGLLISGIVEVIKGWGTVVRAFKNGGILAAIKQIGALLLSGILAPVQGLLEVLSKIPGLGHLAGKGAEKIQELRNLLTAVEDTTIIAEVEPPEELTELPVGLTMPEFNLPDFNMPDFSDMAFGSMGGRSPLHGVVDISNGGIPTSATNAISGFTTSGMGSAAMVNSPPAVLEVISRTITSISAVMRNIETAAHSIDTKLPFQMRLEFPRFDASEDEDAPDYINPRNIAPVTQAERMAHSVQERINRLIIEVAAERGTSARIIRAPQDPRIELVFSGSNA